MLFFQDNMQDGSPSSFKGGFTVTCGQQPALDFLQAFRFTAEDVDYLRTLVGNDDEPLFEEDFLTYLLDTRLRVELYAMPELEGTYG